MIFMDGPLRRILNVFAALLTSGMMLNEKMIGWVGCQHECLNEEMPGVNCR